MIWDESSLEELKKKARFADSDVADNDWKSEGEIIHKQKRKNKLNLNRN
jgi:hypothetical protein